MKFKAATLAVVVVCSSVGWGQPPQSDGVVATLDQTTDQLALSPADVRELQRLDIDQAKFLAVLEAARAYQETHNEALGLEYRLDDAGVPTLIVRSDLGDDKLLVLPETLRNARLDDIFSPRTPGLDLPGIEDLQTSLEKKLKQRGAFEASNSVLGPSSQQQTVDPVVTGILPDDVLRLRQEICPNRRDDCQVDGYRVDINALIRVVEETGQQGAFEACATAQNAFRKGVEFTNLVGDKPLEWRAIAGAEDLARAFDAACLSGPETIPPEILDGLAVLRMPGEETPFCTAFRVGPTQFVTAKHCFHHAKTGMRLSSRLNAAQLFLYADPTEAIEIDRARLPQIPVTSNRPEGPDREIRAREDFAVLHTAAFDASKRTVAIAAPVIGSQVVIPGHLLFADRRTGPPVSLATWAREVRITADAAPNYCRLYDVGKTVDGRGCLIHRCQAMIGFSGSPVLQRTEQGEYQLVGIHVRDEGEIPHHCPGGFALGSDAPIARHGNIASLVTSADVGLGHTQQGGRP